ncbi:hypothetical protein BGX24_010009 [Mortierella sp. AD032]|nr:hypothetical protein BGX24_010009 [Mortierella sp. AD032]
MNRIRTSSISQSGGLDRPRPVYNDSFNQPDEPFECEISAILPQSDVELSVSDTEDYQDDSMCSSFQETTNHHDHQNHPQDTLHSRYLEVESASWPTAHQDEGAPEGDDYDDDEEEDDEEDDQFLGGGRARLSTIAELSELPSINLNHNHHNNNLRSHFNTHNPHRTPSALAITNTSSNHHHNTSGITAATSTSRRQDPAQSGHLVISRDLVLEDLFVEGQDEAEHAEEEIRQQLMANLKPTDILGPIHETRDFQLSSLTGPGHGRQWDQQDQHVPQDEGHPDDQDMDDEEEQNSRHDSFVREDGESDLSSTALELKREYEALFGSKGAVDSERSGSDANGLLGYDNSDDLYARGDDDEDDEDDFFGDEDDEEDEREEELYAMLEINGGAGNMILGNNIPRKPRVLAPPPGSRLPVPGSASKEKVPLPLQSKIVSRVPTVRSPLPSAPASGAASPAPSPSPASVPSLAQPVSRIVAPTTGLRPPQVAAKRGPETMSSLPGQSTATPAVAAIRSSLQPSKASGSILDGLWKEPEYDSQPEESPGAIFAAKIAKELMKEKRESQLTGHAPRTTSMLKPPSKLPARSTVVMPESDVESLTNMLKIEEAPAATATASARPQSMLIAPTPVSKLARPSIVPPRVRSVASPNPSRSLTSSPVRAPSKSPIPSSSAGSSPRSVSTYTKSKAETSTSGQRSGTVTPKNPSKATNFVRDAPMDVSVEQQERPHELSRRRSAERKRHLQRQLELIEAEEAEEAAAAAAAAEAEEKRMATPRKLSVRTSEMTENRRSKDFHQSLHRRSSERERERGSVPTSPLSPMSPHRSTGISSKRSSLYDMNGERKVPSLEESCKQLAKIRQDIVELREEIYQDQPGTSLPSPTSAGPRLSTGGKRPSGRDRDRERESNSRRNSLENKSRPQLGRSDSYQSSAPSSPEVKVSTRRHFFGDILGKLSRNGLHVSTSGPAPSSTSSSQQQSKTSPTYRKSQAPTSQPHPLKPMSRSMMESEQPAAVNPRTPTTSYPGGRSSTHRHSTVQPGSPVASRDKHIVGYEDRYHSNSSGQSAEFYDEPAYYDQYHYTASTTNNNNNNNPYKQSQSAMSASHRARQQQQQRQLGSNQMSHHFRQAHDGSLILSDSPPFTSALADGLEFGAGCPAQIRPKELRFSNSVGGEIQATVTLSNRSNRAMHYEILRPAGISVSPSYGVIQPGRDQRLNVHLAENRGPGRIVVELDNEWLVPFSVSFE